MLMDISGDILIYEREMSEYIDFLTSENPSAAEKYCMRLLDENKDKLSSDRAVSRAYARCLCRFLLHKKNKSRLTETIKNNETIRRALFGYLNTYKHSLVFIMKRVFRQNDIELTKGILKLLETNPYRDENAKPYSDRWSLDFLISETMKAPADYLNLSDESLKIIKCYYEERKGSENEKKDS